MAFPVFQIIVKKMLGDRVGADAAERGHDALILVHPEQIVEMRGA